MIRGVDCDNYDGSVSVERFQVLHDQYNVRFCIVGCQVGDDGANYTAVQTTNSIAGGIAVPYHYEFLYWNENDITRLQRAASFGLPVLIDCETVRTGWNVDRYIERIHQGKEALVKEGLYGGIYTGEWWWPGNTHNCTDFKADVLWHAAYPYGSEGLPPEDYLVDFTKFHPYGGWARPTIWQYADVCYGEPNFDMNMMEEIPVTMKDGIIKEGHSWALYNEGQLVWRVGSIDGTGLPGQTSKRFGDNDTGTDYYLRHESGDGHTSNVIFSDTPGD